MSNQPQRQQPLNAQQDQSEGQQRSQQGRQQDNQPKANVLSQGQQQQKGRPADSGSDILGGAKQQKERTQFDSKECRDGSCASDKQQNKGINNQQLGSGPSAQYGQQNKGEQQRRQ